MGLFMVSIKRFMLISYAIREMLLPSFNQSITQINANSRIAKGLAAFKNAVKAPSFAAIA